MLEKIRKNIRNRLKPIAKRIVGINPNTLTLLGLFMSFIAAGLFATRNVFMAGIVLLIGSFFDALDGAVARENDRITAFGGFLDSVSDRFSDSAIILGAMYGNLTEIPEISNFFPGWLIGVLAIIGSLLVSYTRARAEATGTGAAVGIGERATRITIIVIGAFLNMVNWAIALIVVVSFITVFQRIIHVKKSLK